MREVEPHTEPAGAAPAQFKVLQAAIWVIWLLDFFLILFGCFASGGNPGYQVGEISILGFRLWVQISLAQRKKWARFVMTIIALVVVIGLVLGGGGWTSVFGLIALVCGSAILYLVNTAEVRRWCDR